VLPQVAWRFTALAKAACSVARTDTSIGMSNASASGRAVRNGRADASMAGAIKYDGG